jgi:arsenate reductase
MKMKVLFLCATNSVQSPIAEALLRRSEHFIATSAGIDCRPIHPLTVEVMRDIGIDLESHRPLSVHDLASRDFDFVISLCDQAKDLYSLFPNAEHIHWQFDDPTVLPNLQRQQNAFQVLRDQMMQRIHLFVLVQVRFRTIHISSSDPVPQSLRTAPRANAQSAGK